MFLQDAANWLNPRVWGGKLELGQRLLAAHLATMSLRRGAGGQITDVGAGPSKISYKSQDAKSAEETSYSQTSYGIEFRRVMKTLPAARFAIGGGFGFEQYGGWAGTGICSTCGLGPCGC